MLGRNFLQNARLGRSTQRFGFGISSFGALNPLACFADLLQLSSKHLATRTNE